MSRPHGDVATSFSFHLFSLGCDLSSTLQLIFFFLNYFPGRDIKVMSRHPFLMLSSSLGRDLNEWLRHHLTCEYLSCRFIDGSLSRPQSYVVTSFITFWRRDIEMMSRHEFLHLTVSFNLDHVFFVATSFFKSRLHFFTLQFLLQSQIVDVVTWIYWILNFLSRLIFQF